MSNYLLEEVEIIEFSTIELIMKIVQQMQKMKLKNPKHIKIILSQTKLIK